MSSSASCALGDIEIDYAGSGLDRQVTTFSSEDGTVLDTYDVQAWADEHDEVEYILSQAATPPPPGTLVAVHVTIGSSPPTASTGEFLVAYRCDSRSDAEGGNNEVVEVCVGTYGTCPKSASEVADPDAPPSGAPGTPAAGSPSGAPAASPAAPVGAVARFTG